MNLAFLLADDHAVTAVGAYGRRLSRFAQTKHIDALAARGATFEKALARDGRGGRRAAAGGQRGAQSVTSSQLVIHSIATMDKDKNGSIDRDEFTAGFAHFLSGGAAGPINRRRSKP